MLQLKTMKHVATSRMIPGVQSLASWGRSHHRAADLGRMQASLGQMQSQNSRRVWLTQQWLNTPRQRRIG